MRLTDEVRYRQVTAYSPQQARDSHGRWTSKGSGTNPVTQRFHQQLHSDWEGAKAKYRQQFGNIISADDAKELSPEYRQDRSRSGEVHEPSSELAKAVYHDMLKEAPQAGKLNAVVFTAGAPGSGKTTGLKTSPGLKALAGRAHIVYDGTMADPHSSSKKIDVALAHGKDVHVIYVHRDPVESFQNGVLPRGERTGRVVPVDEVASQHDKVRDSIEQLRQKYADNPHVSFHAVDNTQGAGNAKQVPFHQLTAVETRRQITEPQMRSALHLAHATGQVSPKNYAAYLRPFGSRHS